MGAIVTAMMGTLTTPMSALVATGDGALFSASDAASALLSAGALVVAVIALVHTLSARPRLVLDVFGMNDLTGAAIGQVLVVINVGRAPLCVLRVGVVEGTRSVFQYDPVDFNGRVYTVPTMPLVMQPGEIQEFPIPGELVDMGAQSGLVTYAVTTIRGARFASTRARYSVTKVARQWPSNMP